MPESSDRVGTVWEESATDERSVDWAAGMDVSGDQTKVLLFESIGMSEGLTGRVSRRSLARLAVPTASQTQFLAARSSCQWEIELRTSPSH